MAIINANSPLVDKESGQEFYPLTAYNQVVMPDGSKWNGSGIQIKSLWRNPNQETEFPPQTIMFSENYKAFIIIFVFSTSNIVAGHDIVIAGKNSSLRTSGFFIGWRAMSATERSITFNSAIYVTTYGNPNTTENNAFCVPAEIFGIK